MKRQQEYTNKINLNSASSQPASNKNNNNKQNAIKVESAVPKNRQELLKWNGWGYKDSQFIYRGGEDVRFTSKRYPIGDVRLPHFFDWVIERFNVDLNIVTKPKPQPSENDYPESKITQDKLEKIKNLNVPYSVKGLDRLIRSHGQTLEAIYNLRSAVFKRIPDIVVWPTCHEDCVKIVNLANEDNFVVIAYGGGTAVSGATDCPDDPRPIISLDTSQMNRILWIDRENLVACCESGIIGQDLERELGKLGYVTGHEPDSYEFSSLGGWVATRASGMKKNVYGNIEDLLVQVKMVTAKGVLEKNCQVPRMSCGPDFNHIIMGSEGSLGIITEVIIKIRPTPPCKKFGSIVFPNFESGLNCMREVAKQRCQPASIRLMDNDQFKFGYILKPEESYFSLVVNGLKKFYLTKLKGFDVDQLCVMTLLFEGEESDVKINEKKIYKIGMSCGGVPAGESNGERGYTLTFVIAYVRDFALDYNIVAESFETSVPWDRALKLVQNVKYTVSKEIARHGIKYYLFNCRVTQTYDAGCVIYFYLGFNFANLSNPVDIHHQIETKARDEIVACGGSISHHHGVGKLRKKWYPSTVSNVGLDLYLATKNQLDPNNIFATNNFIQHKL